MSGMIPGAAGSQEPELEYATKGTSARLIEAEAAIQRVREVCGQTKGDTWDSYNQGYNDALGVIECVLDGER